MYMFFEIFLTKLCSLQKINYKIIKVENAASHHWPDLMLTELLNVRVCDYTRIVLSYSGYKCVCRSRRLEVRHVARAPLLFCVLFFPKTEPDRKPTNNKTTAWLDNKKNGIILDVRYYLTTRCDIDRSIKLIQS